MLMVRCLFLMRITWTFWMIGHYIQQTVSTLQNSLLVHVGEVRRFSPKWKIGVTHWRDRNISSGLEVIRFLHFACSSQMSMIFILFINVLKNA